MKRRKSWQINAARLLLVVVFLAVWQYAPVTPGLQDRYPIFDRFVISSPEKVATQLWQLLFGDASTQVIWPFLGRTLEATALGTASGLIAGMLMGLALSNSETTNRVLRPFLMLINATPRVALIPIVVVILGPNAKAAAATAGIVVFFLVFYNAFEGGRSVPLEVIHSGSLFGANPLQLMVFVRFRYVLAWTFAGLPNAISFGLLAVVTAEILTGVPGVGSYLVTALNSVQTTLTLALVVVLAVVGATIVMLTSLLRKRLLHWWDVPNDSSAT